MNENNNYEIPEDVIAFLDKIDWSEFFVDNNEFIRSSKLIYFSEVCNNNLFYCPLQVLTGSVFGYIQKSRNEINSEYIQYIIWAADNNSCEYPQVSVIREYMLYKIMSV